MVFCVRIKSSKIFTWCWRNSYYLSSWTMQSQQLKINLCFTKHCNSYLFIICARVLTSIKLSGSFKVSYVDLLLITWLVLIYYEVFKMIRYYFVLLSKFNDGHISPNMFAIKLPLSTQNNLICSVYRTKISHFFLVS